MDTFYIVRFADNHVEFGPYCRDTAEIFLDQVGPGEYYLASAEDLE